MRRCRRNRNRLIFIYVFKGWLVTAEFSKSVTTTGVEKVVADIVLERTNASKSVLFSRMMVASPLWRQSRSAVAELEKFSAKLAAISAQDDFS